MNCRICGYTHLDIYHIITHIALYIEKYNISINLPRLLFGIIIIPFIIMVWLTYTALFISHFIYKKYIRRRNINWQHWNYQANMP